MIQSTDFRFERYKESFMPDLLALRTMKLKVALSVLLLSFDLNLAKVQIFPADIFEDCSDGGKSKYIDFSGLEHEYVNDTEYFMTGLCWTS